MRTKNNADIQKMTSQDPDVKVSNFSKFLESSLDALDRLYRPDRPRVVEAVSNNSFQKD